MSTHSSLRPAAGLCLAAALILPLALSAQAADVRISETSKQEGALLELGAQLAEALERQDVRDWVHRDIATSPFVEYRIALSRTVAPEKSTAFSESALAALQRLPDLELYFPLPEHRKQWDGRSPAAVAVPIGDGFQVFWGDGRSLRVSERFEPKGPTLLLGPSEIQFDDAPSALRGGERTGSYLRQAATRPVAGSSKELPIHPDFLKAADTDQHSFLTYLDITGGNHDPFRGSMEIEVFGYVDGGHGECVRFTGIETGDAGKSYPNLTHLIATAAPTVPSRLRVEVYEDDAGDKCEKRPTDDYLGAVEIIPSDFGRILTVNEGPGHAEVAVLQSNFACGDSSCDPTESCSSCPSDCGICSCGNGVCSGTENCLTCGADCGPCQISLCGNSLCEFGETCNTCPGDCGACAPTCGNGICDIGETAISCPNECGVQ
ncbi:MAG: hypothetical protein AAGM22_28955 [Acidobacteriota bacterium]